MLSVIIGLGIVMFILAYIAVNEQNILLRYGIIGLLIMVFFPGVFNYNNVYLMSVNSTDADTTTLINTNSGIYSSFSQVVYPLIGVLLLVTFLIKMVFIPYYSARHPSTSLPKESDFWKW